MLGPPTSPAWVALWWHLVTRLACGSFYSHQNPQDSSSAAVWRKFSLAVITFAVLWHVPGIFSAQLRSHQDSRPWWHRTRRNEGAGQLLTRIK